MLHQVIEASASSRNHISSTAKFQVNNNKHLEKSINLKAYYRGIGGVRMSFVSLKHGEVYSVTNQYGDMDETLIGTGIYYKDTRFLKRYVMKVNNQPCIFLKKKNHMGFENRFILSNEDIQAGDDRYEKMDLEINRSL